MKLSLPPSGTHAEILDFAGRAVEPLAGWMLRSGIGYREFCLRLKHVFLRAAQTELQHRGVKQTETALCVLSGLHRKDVHALLQLTGSPVSMDPPSDADADDRLRRLVGLWLAEWHNQPLPFAGSAPSFEALVRMAGEGSALAALSELSRRGIVECRGDQVHLLKPDDVTVSLRDAGDSVAAHVNALVDQLSGGGRQMANSLLLEDLSPESLQRLEDLARQAWTRAAAEVAQEARLLSRQDAGSAAQGRYRFGMFGCAGPGVAGGQMAPAPEAAADEQTATAPD